MDAYDCNIPDRKGGIFPVGNRVWEAGTGNSPSYSLSSHMLRFLVKHTFPRVLFSVECEFKLTKRRKMKLNV
jgi:hypothetical protein